MLHIGSPRIHHDVADKVGELLLISDSQPAELTLVEHMLNEGMPTSDRFRNAAECSTDLSTTAHWRDDTRSRESPAAHTYVLARDYVPPRDDGCNVVRFTSDGHKPVPKLAKLRSNRQQPPAANPYGSSYDTGSPSAKP